MLLRIIFYFMMNLSILTLPGDYKPFCYFPEYFHTTLKPLQQDLDIKRYSGKWHEVFRSPFFYAKDCLCNDASYEYDYQEKKLKVKNTCYNKNGSTQSGIANGYSKNVYNTFFKVYFFPIFGGNYFIIDLDENYQWVIVSEPCKDNYWLLSRTITLEESFMQEKLQKLKNMGFDISNTVYRSDKCKLKTIEA